MFGLSTDQKESAFKPSMFEKPKEEGDGENDDDDEGVQAEPEAPIYAESGAKDVVFKSGVEIQKSPYTKLMELKVAKFKIITPKDRHRKMDQGTLSLEVKELEGKK